MEPRSFTVEVESSAGGPIKIPFDVRDQRAHVDSIEEAKRPETRVRRVGKAVEMLTEV